MAATPEVGRVVRQAFATAGFFLDETSLYRELTVLAGLPMPRLIEPQPAKVIFPSSTEDCLRLAKCACRAQTSQGVDP